MTQGRVYPVHVRVLPWYLAGALWGFLGIITHKIPLYRAFIGISHRGTLVGVGVHHGYVVNNHGF